LKKGQMVTCRGFFKPEEWSDKDGVKHNRIIMVATSFGPAEEKEEPAGQEAKTSKAKK